MIEQLPGIDRAGHMNVAINWPDELRRHLSSRNTAYPIVFKVYFF